MDASAERAFGDFVVARSLALGRFAYLLCGDWHRAEDAVQTAFTKLYLRWSRLDDIAPREPKAASADPRQFVDQSLVREVEATGFVKQLYKR